MEHNEKIKCPSCDKEINKLANLCIHCRVNLIQHRKDHPLVDDDENIDISTQIAPNLRNEDVIQRLEDNPLIEFLLSALFAIILIIILFMLSEYFMYILIAFIAIVWFVFL